MHLDVGLDVGVGGIFLSHDLPLLLHPPGFAVTCEMSSSNNKCSAKYQNSTKGLSTNDQNSKNALSAQSQNRSMKG
jgi:hypothetical protein